MNHGSSFQEKDSLQHNRFQFSKMYEFVTNSAICLQKIGNSKVVKILFPGKMICHLLKSDLYKIWYRGHQFEKYSFEKNAFEGSNTITTNKILTHRQSAIYHIFYSTFGCNLHENKNSIFLISYTGLPP